MNQQAHTNSELGSSLCEELSFLLTSTVHLCVLICPSLCSLAPHLPLTLFQIQTLPLPGSLSGLLQPMLISLCLAFHVSGHYLVPNCETVYMYLNTCVYMNAALPTSYELDKNISPVIIIIPKIH